MSIRKSWSEEQDKVLKHLKQEVKIKKWSEISKIMEIQYKIFGRTQKQCRQRYHSHLDSSINTQKLTEYQEKLLYKLHNEIGNKWSNMVSYFKGRTDNILKNFYHSKLRGAIRKLNRYIKQQKLKNQKRPYPLNLVYKIVRSSDIKSQCNPKQYQFFNKLKNGLIEYNQGRIQNKMFQKMNYKQISVILIRELNKFKSLNLEYYKRWEIPAYLQTSFWVLPEIKNSENKIEEPALFLEFRPEKEIDYKVKQQTRGGNSNSQRRKLSSSQTIISYSQQMKSQDIETSSEKDKNFKFQKDFQSHYIEAQQAEHDNDIAELLQEAEISSMNFIFSNVQFHWEQSNIELIQQNSLQDQNWLRGFNSYSSYDEALFQ